MNYELRWPPSANKGSVRDPLVKPCPFIQGWTNQGWSTQPNGPWDPKKPSLNLTGFAVLQWVHHFTKKNVGSKKNIHSKPSRKIKEWFTCLFCFDLANAKNQETPFDPKNPTNYSIGCWNLLMILWMEKISPFPKELIGIVSVQFLFSNKENPWKSTTI